MSRALKVTAVVGTILGAVLGTIGLLRNGPQDLPSGNSGGKLRIVSVAPSVTEILFMLGMGDCLVGVTDHCDYPPEAKRIEQIGGFGKPTVEKLLALSPDLVVAAGFERSDLMEVLRTSGIRVVDVRIRNFEELFDAMREIARAVNRSQKAEDLIAGMGAELESIVAEHAATPREQRPRVFVEIWDTPLTTAGANSFLDDVIERAGGFNVGREIPQPHPRINPEKVIEWDPQVIVVAHMKRKGTTVRQQLSQRIGWANISAVRSEKIVNDIPPDLLLRPGPRLIEGVRILASRLHQAQPDRNAATGNGG